MSNKQTFKLTALSAALLAVYGPAVADDAEIARLIKPESSVSIGIGNWSNERPQQGIYDGMRKDGAYGLIDADVVKRDDATGTWATFTARNLGTDAREIGAGYERQGDFGAFIRYNQISRDTPYVVNTGLQGIGSGSMTISGSGANALPIREVNLGTERKQLDLKFTKHLSPELEFSANFRHENKDGTRHWGLGSQPYFMVEPIDSTTRQLDVTLSYVGKAFQLSGGYYGSWYDNANKMAWGLINGAAQPGTTSAPNPTPLSLPLDNHAHQLFLDGGYDFTGATRATFKISHSRAIQNEPLPTYGLAVPNDRFLGAPSSLNGRIDTTLVQLGLNSRPTSKLSVVANVRYHDVSDKTPLAGFVGNNTTGAVTVHNTPHSFTTTAGKLEATYRLPQGFNLVGGVDLSKQDRTHPLFAAERYVPFRTNLDETTYRIQLRRSLSDTLNGSLAYLHGKRDGSAYTSTNEPPSDEINPIHIADRKRDKWRLTLDWTPFERLAFQMNYEDGKDRYGHDALREYGLRDGKARLFSLDANYTISRDWQITAWYSQDTTSANQFTGRWTRVTEEHEADKEAHLEDQGKSLGLGLRGKPNAKLQIGADLQWTRTHSRYNEDVALTGSCGANGYCTRYPTSSGVTAAPLPDIENKITLFKFFATYALQRNADVRVDFIHERWNTNDWSWMFANGTPFTYGTTVDGTYVTANPKQTSNFIGARYIYKFQ